MREICGRKELADGVFMRAKEERGREKKRKRGADSMEQRREGYGRHSETVERGTDGRTDRRMDGLGGEEARERASKRERERERKKETNGWGSSQTPRGKLSNYTGGSASRPPSSSPSAAPMIKTPYSFSATTRARMCVRARASVPRRFLAEHEQTVRSYFDASSPFLRMSSSSIL